MKVTLNNGHETLTVECETYSITPKYSNVWVKDFKQASHILQHRLCEGIRMSLMRCAYNTWQVGFKTDEIRIEI